MHDIPDLDKKGLRNFALTTGAIVIVLFGLGFPWLLEFGMPSWPWVVGGGLILWGLVAPSTLRPVYRAWMRLGLLLNWISSRIILSTVFYVLITPMGLFMRLIGRDPMQKAVGRDVATYRTISRRRRRNHMKRPF